MDSLYDAYPAAPASAPPSAPSPIAASIYDAYPAAPQQPTVSQPKEAVGAMESIKAGFQASVPGLAWRGKLPDLISNPEHSQWWERALTGITQVGSELLIMGVGGAAGAIVGGSAGTAVAPGPGTAAGTVLGTGAGMFGLPAAMRQTLIEAYKAGDIKTGADYWNAFKEIAAVTAKESAIGAATMGAGGIAARAFGKAIAPAIGESISVGTGTKAIGAADVAAQIGTMVTIPAALQGRIPDAQEFLDAAIVIGGLKAAHPIAQRIVDTFVRTGRTPAEQVADAQADPEIAADLRKETPAPVNPEMTNRATMLAENRLTELAMKADTEQLTDAERAERVFLANNKAKPERLAEYYNLSPDIAAERLPLSKVDIQDGAQRVYADVLDQLRDVDLARRDAGRTPLGDDHAMAVAALVRARVVARSTRLGISPEELYATRRLQIVDEAQTEVKGDTPPEGAATFTPPEADLFGNPVEVNNAPRHAVENLATQEVPLANLVLSTEVPQFKGQANDQGVIVPLGGSFDRTGVGPIQVWERKDGTMEVISGRHRLDLAKRTGEETIPAQIHRESDGFTARMAATLDAQLNIREEQGNVADYAQYFKDAGITKEAADELGLLARAKGRTGFAIARDASPDLAAAHRAGQLSDEAAFSISAAAPGSERLQALGIAMVNQGKSALVAVNTMKAVELMAAENLAAGKQGDIFGFDDSAMLEAAAMAKKASSIQRHISEQISAVSGASRRPELARKMGVDVADPEGIQKRIKELKQEQYLWDNWPIHPELVAQLRGEVPAPKASPPAKYSPEIQKKLDEAKLEHDSHVEMIKRSDLGDQGARLKGEGMRYAATKREITGELTVKEQAAKDGREAGNYIGKEVSVDGFDATVTANPFGKVTVQFADGTKRTVEADQIKDRPRPPADDGILHQAETPAEGAARDREAVAQALRKQLTERPDLLFQSKERIPAEKRTVEVDGVRRPITNSEGRHIALTATDQIAFWKWFGDSKAVDADGKPQAVYHGTMSDFSEFKSEKAGSNTRHPTSRLGFWFSESPDVANLFNQALDESTWPVKFTSRPNANTMPVYLSIKNPYVLSVEKFRDINGRPYGEEFEKDQPIAAQKTRDWIDANKASLLAKGFDGIKVEGDGLYADRMGGEEYAATAWVAFEPTQIKSSIGNRGTFDPTDPNILKQAEGQSENRGSYAIAENLITTLQGADRSTVVHELGHSWLEELKSDAARKDAPVQIKADWDILRRELAIPENGVIERTSHEQFARSVERYLMEGEAPSPELRSIFAQFKQWLLDIYQSVMALKVEINPELKGVLDRMLAVEQDAKDAAELNVPRAYVAEARATEAAKIVPPEGVKKAPGFKDEQLALEPYADELLTGPGSGATNDSRVNAQYINGPMDFKLAIQQMANRDQPNIQAARGGQEGVKSWEQANAEVDRLAEQVMGGKMSDNLFRGDPNAPSHDIQQRYAFRVMMAITQYSLKLRDAVLERGPNATVQDQFDYLSSIVRMRMAHAEFLGLRAASARALNQIRDMTPESGAVEKMIEATGGDGRLFQGEKTPAEQAAELETKLKELMAQHFSGKGALDIAKLHKDIKGLKGNLQLAKAVTDATKWEMVVEGWKSGLLSGPVTHTTNIFGTEAFFSLRPAVDMLAAVIGIARGASPGMGETDRASMSEAVARLTGMISGVKDGLKVFGASFMADEATQKTESYRTAIPGRAGQIIRTPLRLMSAADDMNQTIYRRGELKTLAIRQAFDENLNPNTRTFSDRVEFLVDNPTPEITTIAEEAGARMSFNAPLGEKGIALQLFVQKWNLQWMIPFIRTPINIAKELARMSPFSPLVGEWRAAVKKGGVERDRALAEMALGTGIMALTIGYAFGTDDKGRKLITGAGSPDPGKNRSKAGVEQPYSVLVGDTYYEYARIAPTGTLIGLAADVANVWDHLDDEEKDQIPKMLAVAFSNAVTNQTFLQGITNFVNATSDPTRFAPRFLQQLAASTVPNIIGQPTAMADPVVRQVNSALEAVYARLPGFREQLEPKVDWLGQDVKTKERLGVIGPSRTLDVTEDKVRLEAARLDLSLADAPKKTHIGKGTGKLGDVELTPEERTKYAKVGGEMAHKILTEIVNEPNYDAIPDLIKKKIFRQVLTASHRLAAVQALPMDKRIAHLNEITEKMAQELAPGGEQ